ncbi:Guanine nucleotide-binding protein-like 3-like protein [Diplonema papillatum]|nr:Guanine nucleotide-binding protein-like 3-like protein [Diplonema papillatum]
MAKVRKKTSKRISTKQRVKVTKKVSRFKREARRTSRKLKKTGLVPKRKEKDPLLAIPNNWPGKEEILRAAIEERKQAIEDKKKRKEIAKQKREWEKKNPEKARVRRARLEHKALQLEQAEKEAAKSNQVWAAQFAKVLPRVNCILHVLDCRAPLASLSLTLETLVKEHQDRCSHDSDAKNFKELLIVYVLNKADLTPRDHIEHWIRTLSAVLTDDPKRKIRRRLSIYTSTSTSSPGILMQQIQTVWLRSAAKHKVTSVVTGFSNVGKKTIVRDLEVTSRIVSVRSSVACPVNPRTKIPGATEFCLITLPTDSDLASSPAKGADCLFKSVDNLEKNFDFSKAEGLADALVAGGPVKVSTHFRIAKATSGAHLLQLLAKKRNLVTEDKQLDLSAAADVVVREISTGKLLIAETVLADGAALIQQLRLGSEPVTVLSDTFHVDILKDCQTQKSKLIELPHAQFTTKDHTLHRTEVDKILKLAGRREEKDKVATEATVLKTALEHESAAKSVVKADAENAYKFDQKDWEDAAMEEDTEDDDGEFSIGDVEEEEDEECEELEEDEEMEEDA